MKPSGVQAGEGDRPTRPSDAGELGGRAGLIRERHRPKDRQGRVEGRVGERDLLGVAVAEVDRDPLGCGALRARSRSEGM